MNKIALCLTTFLSVMVFTGCSSDSDEILDDVLLESNTTKEDQNGVLEEGSEGIINTAPEFSFQTFTINENVEANYSVGFLSAIDKENHSLEFFMQNRDVPFVVNEITGEITVSSNDLDFEIDELFEFEVAADDGEFSTRANIIVYINDIKE